MGWWCLYDNKDIVNDFLADFQVETSWTVETTDVSGADIYYSFDGDSWLAALIKVAQAKGKHFRLTTTFRELEWGDFFSSVAGTVSNTYTYGGGTAPNFSSFITSIEVTSDHSPIVNRIFPWGAGNDGGDTYRAKVSLFHLDPASSYWSNVKVKPGPRGAQATISAIGEAYGKDNARYTVDDSSDFFVLPVHQSSPGHASKQ